MKAIQALFLLMSVSVAGICQETQMTHATLARDTTFLLRTRKDLLILPVMINDTLRVNLLVDPRCKSVVLFGKRYSKLLRERRKHKYAEDQLHPVSKRYVSLDNKLTIGPAIDRGVPIVVVSNLNPLNFFTSVHGIMGSAMLADFEIVVNRRLQTVTIKSAGSKAVAHNPPPQKVSSKNQP